MLIYARSLWLTENLIRAYFQFSLLSLRGKVVSFVQIAGRFNWKSSVPMGFGSSLKWRIPRGCSINRALVKKAKKKKPERHKPEAHVVLSIICFHSRQADSADESKLHGRKRDLAWCHRAVGSSQTQRIKKKLQELKPLFWNEGRLSILAGGMKSRVVGH